MRAHHKTKLGKFFVGDSEQLLAGELQEKLAGQVQLIMTSPPFPLNHKKKYGNLSGQQYVDWLSGYAPLLSQLLTPDGSIVIELGSGWESGRPIQSLLTLESLLAFVKHPEAGLKLCQEFINYNPSRMPSPAQWVTVERSRVTDSFTHVWWMSTTDKPKADNRRVLRPYSKSMEKLLETKKFNVGERPSGFRVTEESFGKNNGGAIAHNVFEVEPIDQTRKPRLPNAFSFANTASSDKFSRACRDKGIKAHPARMPQGLASFFIEFLTDEGDLILDPFAGSNTTGFVAEKHGRRWVAIEQNKEYGIQSKLRFQCDKACEGER